MASNLEDQKKQVLPYLQRAEEIAQVDPKLAYYCRLYAIDQGLKISNRAKEIDGVLKALLVQLEKDKQALGLDAVNDKYACETFALNIFKRADRVDRAGRADINTSKAFYAAFIFLEILNQFGDIDGDLFEKQRYAVWRAAEIRKAVREGRSPAPAPSAEAGPGQQQGDAPASTSTLPPSAWDAVPGAPATQAAPVITAGTSCSASWAPSAAPPSQPSAPCIGELGGQPRFWPGSKVLACPSGIPPLELGTVGKVTPGAGPSGEALCLVALRTQIVELPESQLAPQLQDGAAVLHCNPCTAPVPACVLKSEVDQWPLVYTLQREDGRVVQVGPGELQLPQEATTSVGLPPALLSSSSQQLPAPTYPDPSPASPLKPAPPSVVSTQPAAALAAASSASTSSSSYAHVPGYQPPLVAISEAHKAAKYAVSSLAFEDVASAVKYLNDALRLLTVPGLHK